MQFVGIALLVVAVFAVLFAVIQHFKAKKLLAAPFHRTGEIAQNPGVADAKGLVSTEGAIEMPQVFTAPCSGRPCLYYEVVVERLWEKHENTEDGVKTSKGKTNVTTDRAGARFYVNDGSGSVGVDASADVSCDKMVQSFQQVQNVSSGDVYFGQYHASVAPSFGDEYTRGVQVTERVLEPNGKLFVMGKLQNGVIAKTDGMLGKLTLHPEGRDQIVGGTKKKAMIGFVAAAVMGLPGTLMAALGDPPDMKGVATLSSNCQATLSDALPAACTDRMYDQDGKSYAWTVTKPGTYTVSVTPPKVKNPVWPLVVLTDANGKEIARDTGVADASSFTVPVTAGTYKISVKEAVPGYMKKLKGGFGFSLNVEARSLEADPATAAAADSAAPAASVAAAAPKTGSAQPKQPLAAKIAATPKTATLKVGSPVVKKKLAPRGPHLLRRVPVVEQRGLGRSERERGPADGREEASQAGVAVGEPHGGEGAERDGEASGERREVAVGALEDHGGRVGGRGGQALEQRTRQVRQVAGQHQHGVGRLRRGPGARGRDAAARTAAGPCVGDRGQAERGVVVGAADEHVGNIHRVQQSREASGQRLSVEAGQGALGDAAHARALATGEDGAGEPHRSPRRRVSMGVPSASSVASSGSTARASQRASETMAPEAWLRSGTTCTPLARGSIAARTNSRRPG